MRILGSFGLWIAGIGFFLFSFAFLALSLMIFSRDTSFGLARRLFSVQLRIMGIRLKTKGRENITPGKTYLIMGNHQSLFDIFVIPSAIPLVFTGVEASYHFSMPVWGYLIRKWGCIPINRSNLAEAKKSLEKARQTLGTGLSLAILPEGHRTRTGKMGPFKKGPFYLAKAAQADILPFGIRGGYDFQRRGGFLLSPGKVQVWIGEAISYESVAHLTVDELKDRFFERIRMLAGEIPS